MSRQILSLLVVKVGTMSITGELLEESRISMRPQFLTIPGYFTGDFNLKVKIPIGPCSYR